MNRTRHLQDSHSQFSKLDYHHPGITLFELMAVVCIIGVMSSFGIVSLNPLWQKFQLHQTVSEIESQIQLLRLKAILENSTYQMRFDNGFLIYRKKYKNHWLDWQRYRLKKKAVISVNGSIYFYSKGFSSPRTITIQLQQRYQQLFINFNGRTRTEELI